MIGGPFVIMSCWTKAYLTRRDVLDRTHFSLMGGLGNGGKIYVLLSEVAALQTVRAYSGKLLHNRRKESINSGCLVPPALFYVSCPQDRVGCAWDSVRLILRSLRDSSRVKVDS